MIVVTVIMLMKMSIIITVIMLMKMSIILTVKMIMVDFRSFVRVEER